MKGGQGRGSEELKFTFFIFCTMYILTEKKYSNCVRNFLPSYSYF